MKKKVLIITYYWPPAGGPGVQRVLKFAKYLPEFGWEPIILTVTNGDYPAMDFSLEKEIPDNIKVFRTKTLEPFSLFKKLSKKDTIDTYVLNNNSEGLLSKIAKLVRANFFIPDARVGWKYFALKEAKKIIKQEQPSLIFSTSPPHSVQLIAKRIAKKYRLKWVADFRDPWVESYTNQHLPRTSWARKRDIKLEKSVLQQANFITLASIDFKKLFQTSVKNVQEITNSFDQIPPETTVQETELSIAYAGSMSESQVPHNFLKELGKNTQRDIRFNYYGNITPHFMNTIHKHNLQNNFKHHGYLEKSEFYTALKQNSILLLLMQPYEKGSDNIPLKLFDYLAAKRFIVAFGNPSGRTAHILKETKSGIVFSYNTPFGEKEMKKVLELKNNFTPDTNTLSNYSTPVITKKLSGIFNQLVS